MTAVLISIIGPPAVGKTTLANALAQLLPAEIIKEDYAGNPFLAESFAGSSDARLPGQLYFLMSRLRQLSVAHWPTKGIFISDYGYCQDRIFAALRLGADELRLYERVAKRVDGMIHPPQLLIHLDADVPCLLERIDNRGRQFEHAMNAEFLRAIRQGYHQAVQTANCAVMAINTARRDLRDAQESAQVAASVLEALEKMRRDAGGLEDPIPKTG